MTSKLASAAAVAVRRMLAAMRRLRGLMCAGIIGTVLAFSATATASGTAVLRAASSATKLPGLLTVLRNTDGFVVRPAVIGYTGDGTGYVGGFDGRGRNNFGHITWLTWTTQVATGTGALWGDNGIPNDAEGTFSPVPVKVRGFAPRDGHFTRLTLRYERNGENFIDERGVRFYPSSEIPGQKGFYEYFIVREAQDYVATPQEH
jgi:hypothetical protein